MKIDLLMMGPAIITLMDHLFPRPTMAYLGPGAGLSAIGALLAVIAGIVVAIFGFLWYPFRRLMRKRRKPGNDEKDDGRE
jgi:hypothetical protein